MIAAVARVARYGCRIWLTQPLRAAHWYGLVRAGDVELGLIHHRRKAQP